MADVAGELGKLVKGHSEGARAFRPWWDVVEDNLMYAFITLGLANVPMSFLWSSPVQCTPHPLKFVQMNWTIANFSFFYPQLHCSEEYVDPFLMYLPFTLLLVPAILTIIERTFIVLYRVETKMNKFYRLVVKDCLDDDGTVSKDGKASTAKLSHEVAQAFKHSDGCHASYVYRTLLQILGSLTLSAAFAFYSDVRGMGGRANFDCDIYYTQWLCVIPNARFFLCTYVASLVLMGGYLACSVYNLLWILFPRVGLLSAFLQGQPLCEQTDKLDLYFNPRFRDFSLLVNLVAESRSLPVALRVLCLCQPRFGTLWRPNNVELAVRADLDGKTRWLSVTWDDADVAHHFHSCCKNRYALEYSVEASPKSEEGAAAVINTVVAHHGGGGDAEEKKKTTRGHYSQLESAEDEEDTLDGLHRKYGLTFECLEGDEWTEFAVTISTEVDGVAVAQRVVHHGKGTGLLARIEEQKKGSGSRTLTCLRTC